LEVATYLWLVVIPSSSVEMSTLKPEVAALVVQLWFRVQKYQLTLALLKTARCQLFLLLLARLERCRCSQTHRAKLVSQELLSVVLVECQSVLLLDRA
jgi:hypothetical protein